MRKEVIVKKTERSARIKTSTGCQPSGGKMVKQNARDKHTRKKTSAQGPTQGMAT